MYQLTKYIGKTLKFVQPTIVKREYELRSEEDVLAKIIFPKLFSSRAIVEGFENKWEIKLPSLWRNEFGVYKFGYQMPFARYVYNIWKTKGTIELPKGGRLNCKSGKFKKPFEIYSSRGELVLLYENRFFLKGRTEVIIEKKSELLEKYPWIIMLGWYVILLNKRGRANAAG